MNKDNRKLVDGFLKSWNESVEKGYCSNMGGIEICAIEIFVDWLKENYDITETTRNK